MTDLGRYILEEWAEDYREGRLARREFLRRVVIFGGGAARGTSVLAALGIVASADEAAAAGGPAPPAVVAAAPVVSPDDPSLETRMVSYPGTPPGPRTVIDYLAQPKGASHAPGVVVIHENRGLVGHIQDVARRLAKIGCVALAPDLLSGAGGTDTFSDPAQIAATLGQIPPEQLVAMPAAGVRYLQSLPAARADRVGAVGFCFGGGVTWRLATVVPGLRAAAPFYGVNPPLGDVPNIRAAVLA